MDRPGTLVGPRKAVSRLRTAARSADRALAEAERILGETDIYGTYRIPAGVEIDEAVEAELLEFLRFARHLHGKQELEVIVVAHQGVDKEDESGTVRRERGDEAEAPLGDRDRGPDLRRQAIR